MNYREARQIKDGPNAGKWHYTNMRDGKIWPTGACRGTCPGHDTPEEAYEHERQRLLELSRFEPMSEEIRKYEPGKCCRCDNPATHRIDAPGRYFLFGRVCDEHATDEVLDSLVTCGPSTSSW